MTISLVRSAVEILMLIWFHFVIMMIDLLRSFLFMIETVMLREILLIGYVVGQHTDCFHFCFHIKWCLLLLYFCGHRNLRLEYTKCL